MSYGRKSFVARHSLVRATSTSIQTCARKALVVELTLATADASALDAGNYE